MKLEKFKEENKKKIGIIVFTITCILLISGVILYRTFAIFEVNNNLDLINGSVQDTGDIEFAFYIDENLSKTAPEKGTGYSLDTSSSYCKDVLNGNQVSNISWNDENWSIEIKNVSTTKTKCYLYFKEIYKESILNGAIPDLGNGRLIPVTIENNGKVYKANILDKENPWYSYEQKRWANAVILKDGVVDNYKPGNEIKESDIESYFVWIPRYRYQIFNDELYETGELSNEPSRAQEIQIQFENKNIPIQKGNEKNEWFTHPAFTSFNSNGFWVGKFETGYDGALDQSQAEQNVIAENKIIIKPNVYSWRGIQVANIFYNSYNYQRELESHMMKNTEWGAVAYLSYSKYGYTGNINSNSNVNYLTGYEGTDNQWNTNEGKKASNIQNITGIYDMAGGAWDTVAGVMLTENKEYITGETETTNSGFIGIYGSTMGELQKSLTKEEGGLSWKENRYYDFYEYNTNDSNYSKRIFGDATGEMGPFSSHKNNWFNTHSYFISNIHPWFIRGGLQSFPTTCSIFGFSNFQGQLDSRFAFRIVLTP